MPEILLDFICLTSLVYTLYRLRLQQTGQFTYRSLAQGDFRILYLLEGERGDPFRGVLRSRSLESPTTENSYECLSYVWDQAPIAVEDSERVQEMILLKNEGDAYFRKQSIAPNLSLALSEIRKDGVERALWVDSICINQNDMLEKPEQIDKMSQIYGKAERVIAWLGPYDKEFMDMLRKLDKSLKAIPGGWLLGTEIFEHNKRVRNHFRSELVESDRQALMRILNLRFWERSWILQEVSVGKEVVFQLGFQEIYWDDIGHLTEQFEAIAPNYANDQEMLAVLGQDAAETKIRIRLRPMQLLRYQWAQKWKYGEFRLLTLVQSLENWQCKDPRDRVFSLLALVNNKDAENNAAVYDLRDKYVNTLGKDAGTKCIDGLIARFRADYPDLSEDQILWTNSIIYTYGQLIISHANTYHRLDGLSQSGHGIRGLPSWIPNFSSLQHRFSLRDGIYQPWEILHKETAVFAAGLAQPLNILWKPSVDLRRLQVRALYFDEVVAVVNPLECPKGGLPLDEFYSWASDVSPIVQGWASRGRYGDSESQDEAIRRMSIANFSPKRTFIKAHFFATREELYRKPDPQGLALRGRKIEAQGTFHEMALLYSILVYRIHMNRRLFVTESGYIGLGPDDLKEGDLVYLFYGGQTPYIVRRYPDSVVDPNATIGDVLYGGQFKFIGESYVQGIMMGEALRWYKDYGDMLRTLSCNITLL